MIRGVLLDLAGVLYEGDRVLPGALAAVAQLHEAGLPIRFITNTTTKTKQALLSKLQGLGLAITEEELFTPGHAARLWLAEKGANPHLLVHPDLREEFEGLPAGGQAEGPCALVVGDAGQDFTYGHMNEAFRALIEGADFIALAKNRTFKDDDGKLSLDAGAFVTALEYSSGKRALVLGKPSPDFYAAALASMGCAQNEAVMVGDDAQSDISGALNAGLAYALLVRTGKYQVGDETRFQPHPSAVVPDIGAAAAWIIEHKDKAGCASTQAR